MPTTTSTVGGLQDLGTKVATYQHPTYVTFAPRWRKAVHVREGLGGFLDGTYLVAHPREWLDHSLPVKGEDGKTIVSYSPNPNPKKPSAKLKERRALARYENFAATIVDQTKAALFREAPTRKVGERTDAEKQPSDLERWWEDVDGKGTHIDDFVKLAWDAAATEGYVYIYMDRPAEPERGAETDTAPKTAADAKFPFLRLYTPLDVPDWLVDDQGFLSAVKFQEAPPRDSFEVKVDDKARIRTVTDTRWALYDSEGKAINAGDHLMGRLPVVILYAKQRPNVPVVGESVIGDPQLYIDLYNLTSELRELLRKQTFSILNIPLGTGQDAMTVEQAQALLGASTGTGNVLFSGSAAQYITADAQNVAAYQDERRELLRHIYRLASIAWESDSQDAEAEGSLKLKREDMNQALAGYADECEKTEYALAELFYRAVYGDTGEQKFENDKILIQYPQTFDMTPFDVVLAQAQAAMTLGMPSAFLKELRKRLIPKFLPDLAPDELKDLQQAVDEMPDDLTPDEKLKARMEATAGAFGKAAKDDKGHDAPPAKKEAA